MPGSSELNERACARIAIKPKITAVTVVRKVSSYGLNDHFMAIRRNLERTDLDRAKEIVKRERRFLPRRLGKREEEESAQKCNESDGWQGIPFVRPARGQRRASQTTTTRRVQISTQMSIYDDRIQAAGKSFIGSLDALRWA